jgi:hypothetical protein
MEEMVKGKSGQAIQRVNREVGDENKQIRKVLHEPVSPYLAETYNMIIHLIQGVVLASLFVVLIENELTARLLFKIIPVFFLAVVIWHSYFVHDQYIAQRARLFDTLAPIMLGVSQGLVVWSIPRSISEYALFFAIVPLLGIVAYMAPLTAYRNPATLELFKEHFREQGKEFAVVLHSELKRFDKHSVVMMAIISFALGVVATFIYYVNLSEDHKTYLATILIVLILTPILRFDMRRFLNRSERLRKYGYRW